MKTRSIIAILAITAALGAACTTARGEKIGTITKLALQGPFCPTWEGQIIRGGISGGTGAFGAPFDFTLANASDAETFRELMESGQEVKLNYYSYFPTFCASDSGHFVTSFEAIQRPGR